MTFKAIDLGGLALSAVSIVLNYYQSLSSDHLKQQLNEISNIMGYKYLEEETKEFDFYQKYKEKLI